MLKRYDWLFEIPVHANDRGAWLDNREAHVAHLKPYIDDGTIIFAGPTLLAHPKSPEDGMAVTGSVMLFKAGSAEEVRGILKENPFVKIGVWDMESAKVSPFLCVLRKPLSS